MKLSHTVMIEIIEKLGTDGLVMEPVEVGEVRKVSEVHLPFFVAIGGPAGP